MEFKLLLIQISIFISFNIKSINNIERNSIVKEGEERKKYISFFLNSTVETLDDENFDKKVQKGIFHNYIILFTVKKCDICNKIITTLENVQKKYLNDNETNLKFGKIDILMSGWTSMRFELERLPNIIYISNRTYAIYPYDNLTEENIIEFIENKNKIFKKFPRKMGYFDVFMKIFHIISGLLHEKFPFWNEGYSWVLVIAFVLFFCFVEYLIIKFCCRRTKKENKDQNQHQHQHQHSHQHKKEKNISKNLENTKKNKSKMD
jgi:hypothetical protein